MTGIRSNIPYVVKTVSKRDSKVFLYGELK